MAADREDLDVLRAALAAAEVRAQAAETEVASAVAEATRAQAVLTSSEAVIAALKLEVLKLRRELYGQKSERKARLLDQLELQLEELEATATEDELRAEQAAARASTPVRTFTRRRPVRKPFPEHLPRERVVIEAPATCGCCGSGRIAKLGEDVTETLEVVPRQWKVVQTVREKFTCRDCERITQPPAPFHPTSRGWAGPSLLAMILFEKFGQHQPLNRQAERYAREGVELSLSTLADQVGACAVALAPLHALIEAHVLAAERLHGDDTPVPVLAKGKTDKGRLWVYVRDDRPFGGSAPPAALFQFSRNRRGEHPKRHLEGWAGVLQADAYAGFGALYEADRPPRAVTEALCWAHGRRKFFELADIAANTRRGKDAKPISPLALEAVRRIDEIFDLERTINGADRATRLAVRRAEVAPLVADLETWMRSERERLSRHASVAQAMDYMLKRWDRFARFLEDGRICLSNNAAERSLRGVALGRKSWLFCGSERGGDRTAFMYTLITTAKLNDVDPQAWLADVLARIADLPLTAPRAPALGMGAAARRRGNRGMTAIVRLKVTLKDVEPEVMRRLDVPLEIRLDRLHLVLQAAMGWTDSHLYEFTAGGTGWGVPDADFGGGPMPAAKTTLDDVIKDTGARTIHYLYDFGDDWNHVIKIERIGESDPQARYPQLVAAQGRCPPEDVGGPPGYAEFLAAIADPAHEDHDHMLTWCGGAFDPETPDVEHIADELDRLARRWAPRPRKPKTTSPRS